jgi:hypothetical protein
MIDVNKDASTPDITNRYKAGLALEDYLNSPSAQESMRTMAKYSGWAGKSKAELAKYFDPKTASEIYAASNTFPKFAAGSLAKLEAYHGTNVAMGQTQEAFKLADDAFKRNDPVAGWDYFKRAYELAHDETNALQHQAESRFPINGQRPSAFPKSIQESEKNSSKELGKSSPITKSPFKTISMDQLQDYARRSGKSLEEVIQMAKQKGAK